MDTKSEDHSCGDSDSDDYIQCISSTTIPTYIPSPKFPTPVKQPVVEHEEEPVETVSPESIPVQPQSTDEVHNEDVSPKEVATSPISEQACGDDAEIVEDAEVNSANTELSASDWVGDESKDIEDAARVDEEPECVATNIEYSSSSSSDQAEEEESSQDEDSQGSPDHAQAPEGTEPIAAEEEEERSSPEAQPEYRHTPPLPPSLPSPPLPPTLPPVSLPVQAPMVPTPPSPAVRGRQFTEPAWKTANLAPPSAVPEKSSLEQLERDIANAKQELAELENQMESKRNRRDQLRKEYARLTAVQANPPPVILARPRSAPEVPKPEDVRDEFEVRITRAANEPIGLSVGFDEARNCFVVNEVKPYGCVPDLNRANARSGRQIQKGDLIVSVNGMRRDKLRMTREFAASQVVLTIARNSGQRAGQPDLSKWPPESVQAFREISEALRLDKRGEPGPRTGIMNDVPVKLADGLNNNGFVCEICRILCPREAEFVEHMRSQSHATKRRSISTPDLWSKCSLGPDSVFWFEHKNGFWSIDEPNRTSGSKHTVITADS